jgi:hypothetical protein
MAGWEWGGGRVGGFDRVRMGMGYGCVMFDCMFRDLYIPNACYSCSRFLFGIGNQYRVCKGV